MKYWCKVFCFIFCLNTVNAQDAFNEFVDRDYLKTVSLYAVSKQDDYLKRYLNPPIASLTNPDQILVFEFDDIRAQFSRYKVNIIHCEVDWTQSRLLDMEYLAAINEFFLNDFQISQNTKVPYYHYQFVLPKPKISGNFILQLYEDSELVAQKRFMIFESGIDVNVNVQTAHDPEYWKTHQQVNVKLELGNYRVGVPQRELKVLLCMNQNVWKEVNNAHLINSGRNSFTLQQFNNEYLFPAGNEFRFLDVSSSFRKGQNVKEIILGRPDNILTIPQASRARLNYTESYDNDGGFIISNIENTDPTISSDYVNVFFQVVPSLMEEDNTQTVLYGKFTDWNYLPLEYNPDTGLLEYEVLLKNGVYDFNLGLQSKDTGEVDRAFYEGDFNQTGNTYEVFVYHTIPGRRYPSLIGYQIVKEVRQ